MFIRCCIVFIALMTGTGQLSAEVVTDHAGRRVNVPENPQRVVSMAPSITEMVFAVNRGDRLVGATVYSDYPEAAQKIESVGTYVNLDLEKIVSLKPDLCIAIKDGNPLSTVERLEELDIPVYAVNPRDIKSVMESVSDIGSLLGAQDRALEVVTGMKNKLAEIREKVAGVSKRPGVFFQIGIAPIISAGSDTFIHELIIRAGGKNLAGSHTGYPRFSTEEVLSLSPEIIIVTSMARQKVFERVMEKWGQWEDLPAVANDRIYLVNSDLVDRPSPRLVKGLEKMARLIHPELFTCSGEN